MRPPGPCGVGFKPEPWAWSGWEWATEGRFPGRWDDAEGNFRTVYAGSSLKACLMEVLACFRPDPLLFDDLDDIEVDPRDEAWHPTNAPGQVPYSWLEPRTAATATITGRYCDISASTTIAALRPHFLREALVFGLKDFDAAALRDARPRVLTQRVATHVYGHSNLDGIAFTSRLGDDLKLWAIFEQAGDPAASPRLTHFAHHDMSADSAEIREVFRLFGLSWH
ncbi:RES domain-containing protein [Pseudarthrobacter sp. S9]|uniref:RES domain-containing protein n=1 Tax=Pseudarthrobacter sp. S9 TaxID=3418421 RepID=UPI003D073960